MQKIVNELKQLVNFKDTTEIGDIVLVVAKNPQMLMFARVKDIERDSSRRDEWWHVHLTMLTIPLQEIVWTLRNAQMTGQEIFTMGGEERFVKAIRFDSPANKSSKPAEEKGKRKNTGIMRIK